MSHDEELKATLIVPLPISVSDLNNIEDMLRMEGVFCTSFPDQDPYSAALYRQQSAVHGARVRMLIDRNVLARVVALARGDLAKEEHRIPAAVMAFAQCAGIAVEPDVALYECMASRPENRAADDSAEFRAAVGLDASEFAGVALGRSLRLGDRLCSGPEESALTQLVQPPWQYSFVYPAVLAIGLIELEGGSMPQRMRRFLDWTYENWYFIPAATVFAAICFSSKPPRGVLKDLRHCDRSRALKGLSNCAWDLTYVVWWLELVKRQSEGNYLYVLCSLDKALRWVARHLLADPRVEEKHIESLLQDLLGTEYEHYVRLMAGMDDPERVINRNRLDTNAAAAHRIRVVAALECQLIEKVSRS